MTANADSGNIERPISADNNLNTSTSSIDSSISDKSNSGPSSQINQFNNISNSNNEDLFQIAAKAEKLLQEILSAGKNSPQEKPNIKQEPQNFMNLSVPPPAINQPPALQLPQYQFQNNNVHQYYPNQISNFNPHRQIAALPQLNGYSPAMPQSQYGFPPPVYNQVNLLSQPHLQNLIPMRPSGVPFYYQQSAYFPQPHNLAQFHNAFSSHSPFQQHPPVQYQTHPSFAQGHPLSTVNYFNNTKRKFGEINNYTNSSNVNNRFKPDSSSNNSGSSYTKYNSVTSSSIPGSSSTENIINKMTLETQDSPSIGMALTEDDDLNLIRERELKDLKSKSVVEKMSVFLKYYQQFKEAYIHRVFTIECSDSLKLQFHSLIKYLNEYEALLAELNMMITEHEHDHCKNNHRKTKKFFNKTKAFIRYECNKRLQSNIFEYRRLINSQDRYAGMYDMLDMNSYLISLLPDIGVSIRRYINRCEKAKEQAQLEADEEEDTFQNQWEENSNDSNVYEINNDPSDLTIPTFKEFVATHRDDEDEPKRLEDDSLIYKYSKETRAYESFSMGVDSLNRYLLKRVEDEETLDELVKERIIKWINKRQAKYILIFCEVDKLLNQHRAGECYPKFHSYLLFNLGKLVTVCDSYHQKLKELLYSTTIRRKKKRKKVKLLPEAMSDVFDEIMELKRALDLAKIAIKKCGGKVNWQSISENHTDKHIEEKGLGEEDAGVQIENATIKDNNV